METSGDNQLTRAEWSNLSTREDAEEDFMPFTHEQVSYQWETERVILLEPHVQSLHLRVLKCPVTNKLQIC